MSPLERYKTILLHLFWMSLGLLILSGCGHQQVQTCPPPKVVPACQSLNDLYWKDRYNNGRTAQAYIIELEGAVESNCAIINEVKNGNQ